jgi:pyruvate dehydrogenase E2 component (dihydrolipoamide acetyltransferase)
MNRDLSSQGMPQDPFGSAMVTSVGMFGVEEGYGPIIPLSRLPIFLVVTEVRDRPWVEDNKVVVRPIMKIMATLDHRVMDGYKAGQLSAELKRIEDPEKVFGLAEKVPVGHGAGAENPVEPVSKKTGPE